MELFSVLHAFNDYLPNWGYKENGLYPGGSCVLGEIHRWLGNPVIISTK